MKESNRILLATMICVGIMMGWNYMFPYTQNAKSTPNSDTSINTDSDISDENTIIADYSKSFDENYEKIDQNIENHYIHIKNPNFSGSINLKGLILDNIYLNNYKNDSKNSDQYNTRLNHQDNHTIYPNNKQFTNSIHLLRQKNQNDPYYITIGFKIAKQFKDIEIPDHNTLWKADSNSLSIDSPVKLTWRNNSGIEFIVVIRIIEEYMLNVECKIANHSQKSPVLIQYFETKRTKSNNSDSGASSHEGGLIVHDKSLFEIGFDDIVSKDYIYRNNIDWVGFGDKYWLSAIIPADGKIANTKITSRMNNFHKDRFYHIIAENKKTVVPAGETVLMGSDYIFIGPKVLSILDHYAKKYQIELFDRAVDFGYLYFITKPLFKLLVILNKMLNNMGFAILLLTICVKIALFPLSYKGFKNMEKLKKLNPAIQKIRSTYEGKPDLIQKYTIALYKQERVNPTSGCLPIILQMPIFFALYKVFSVSIEMRHAQFFGWIHDLSASDPLTIFNMFGLIPWNPPKLLMIGPIALSMAFTMFIQQKLGPKPTDQTQANMMSIMPLITLIMVSSFPAGLLIYWTWSNILSIVQQIIIQRITGK